MKNFIKTLSLMGTLSISLIAYSGSYAAGLPSIKDDVDTNTTNISINTTGIANNTADIESNALDIDVLQQNTAADYSGYGTPFSTEGAPKNVIVSKGSNSDGSGAYYANIFYANSTEQISIDGMMTTPSLIGKYVFAFFDSNGILTYVGTSTEAPETTEYLEYAVENSTLDIGTGAKTVDDDSYSYTDTCTGSGAIGACDSIEKISGVQSEISQSHVIRVLLGSGSIGSMSFNDLLGRDKFSGTGTRRDYRVHAKGIGRILRLRSGSPAQRVIYYDVNGATGGSLAGTPFESGAVPFGGFFF
jgi:hypothetical protein